MLFFSVKKSFFDAWDNLGALIVSNEMFVIIMMIGFWMSSLVGETFQIWMIFIPLCSLFGLAIVSGVMSRVLYNVSDYTRPEWGKLLENLRVTWKKSLAFFSALIIFFPVSFFGIFYYSKIDSLLGVALTTMLFWIIVSVYLASLWFFPIANRLPGSFPIVIKKSFLVAADNLGLTLFAGFIMMPIQLFLWALTAFGGFGPAGMHLYLNGALRLLIMKYDWLEANPSSKKKDVPWYELLVDEKERVGKRTLKGMIFPWKE